MAGITVDVEQKLESMEVSSSDEEAEEDELSREKGESSQSKTNHQSTSTSQKESRVAISCEDGTVRIYKVIPAQPLQFTASSLRNKGKTFF